jgi:hypothetical protein
MSVERAKKLVEAGVWLRMSGDHEGARRLFEHALKLDPANERAKQLLETPGSPHGKSVSTAAGERTASPAQNPFLPAQVPSRSVGLEVDWGLAATLPESQAALRPSAPPRQAAPPTHPSAWDSGASERPLGLAESLQINLETETDSPMDLLSSDPASATVPAPPAPAAAPSLEAQVQTMVQGAIDLMGLDDHSGAMDLILKAQKLAPDHPDVLQLRERSERTLLKMFESKLGRLDAVPSVLLKQDEVIWLNLDHRAGFVLAQIDGRISFEDLFAVSGMTRLDTARVLAQLKEQGVISVT